jgi:adenosyl cobinamide kinase/adenosyl cobinamide phosphate guanylyltransferase
MLAKFIGGSRDGKVMLAEPYAKRIFVSTGKTREENGRLVYEHETYVRDRDNYDRDVNGEIVQLAYKLEVEVDR